MERANILVVDDSVLVLLGLNKVLLNNDLNAFIASDAKKAFEILNTEKIDLVVLDLMMPEITGIEVLEHMKSNEITKNIPVIVLSGTQETDIIKESLKKGAAEFLYKPINPDSLVAHIENILRKQ